MPITRRPLDSPQTHTESFLLSAIRASIGVCTALALVCWAGCQLHDYARSSPPSSDVTARIHVGMTFAQAWEIIESDQSNTHGYCGTLGKSTAWARHSLPDGKYLVLTYGGITDPMGNIGNENKIIAISLLHFEDLRRDVPPDLFPTIRLIQLSPPMEVDRFNPVDLIRAVNVLQPLGKERALRGP